MADPSGPAARGPGESSHKGLPGVGWLCDHLIPLYNSGVILTFARLSWHGTSSVPNLEATATIYGGVGLGSVVPSGMIAAHLTLHRAAIRSTPPLVSGLGA